MNKYAQHSKAPKQTDDDLLTWKIERSPDYLGLRVTFSDGQRFTVGTRKEAQRVINKKFFATYF